MNYSLQSMEGESYLPSNSLDEFGIGDDNDGDGDGEAEGVDEDDVGHVGVQGGLGPNNTTAELTRNIGGQLKQSFVSLFLGQLAAGHWVTNVQKVFAIANPFTVEPQLFPEPNNNMTKI